MGARLLTFEAKIIVYMHRTITIQKRLINGFNFYKKNWTGCFFSFATLVLYFSLCFDHSSRCHSCLAMVCARLSCPQKQPPTVLNLFQFTTTAIIIIIIIISIIIFTQFVSILTTTHQHHHHTIYWKFTTTTITEVRFVHAVTAGGCVKFLPVV